MRDLFRCAAIEPGLESHRCAQHRTSRVVVLGDPLWLCATRGASLFRAMEAMA